MAESNSFGYWGVTSEEILKSQFPLHRACRDGDVEALSLLLIEAQHDIYVEDSFYGWTPAHWAAYFGKLACLRKLLQQTRVGVDSNIPSSRFCQTPTHLAAFGGHPQALLWLLQSMANADCQDYLGETAVHKAARTGSIECASLLASHGARLYICNKNGLTPAQLAANCGYEECSQFLEAAAQRQESEPRGVYETQGPADPTKVPEPSPHDITAHRVHPCVINQGINGGKLPPSPLTHQSHNGAPVSEDCAMEADDGSSCTHNGHTSTAEADSHDVTLDLGVSTNQKPVGGRKRTREDEDECEIKRMRTQEGLPPSELLYTPSHSHLHLLQTQPCLQEAHSAHSASTAISCVSESSHQPHIGDSNYSDGCQGNQDMDACGEGDMDSEALGEISGDEDYHPYRDILAIPIEPLNRLVITNSNGTQSNSGEGLQENQYWHFVV